jgi:RNase H-fold protein (predicted Holliday junction resolvase)
MVSLKYSLNKVEDSKMKRKSRLILSAGMVMMALSGLQVQASISAQQAETMAVLPWIFEKGTDTAVRTGKETLEKLLSGSGLEVMPEGRVTSAWINQLGYTVPDKELPQPADLLKLGQALKVDFVMAGKASWHSRSIWVGLGPKTKSTCTVDVIIVDVRSQALVLNNRNIKMDSTAKEDTLKALGTLFVSSIFTVVSGGPKTPHEQRAVQLGIGKALEPWIVPRLSRVGTPIKAVGDTANTGGTSEIALPLEVAQALADKLAQQLKEKKETRALVVLPFRMMGMPEQEEEKSAEKIAQPLQEDLSTTLVNEGMRTVEPTQLEEAMGEITADQPDISPEKLAAALGKKLPNALFVIGTISKRGDNWVINARVLDPKTNEARAAAVHQYQMKK